MFKIFVLLMLSVYLVSGQNLPFQNLWGNLANGQQGQLQQGRSGSSWDQNSGSLWGQNSGSFGNSNYDQGSNQQNGGNRYGPNCSFLQSAGQELEQMLGGGYRGHSGFQQQIRELQRILTQVTRSHCGGMQNQGNRSGYQGSSRGNGGYGGNRRYGY